MDLLAGLPEEVRKNIVERTKGIIPSDEQCELHPRHQKLIMPDGTLICPVCHKEETDAKVQEKYSKEHYENTRSGRRNYLYNHSIVANRDLLHKGLKDFCGRTDKEVELINQIKNLTTDVAEAQSLNIYFQGTTGSGKTHLAMALMQNANHLANGKRFLFVNFPTLQQRIRKSYDSQKEIDGEADLIQKMIDCDVLALDDIASEINPLTMQGRIPEFSSRILYSVMEGRSEKKTTIFTSNVAWKDLKTFLDPRETSRMSYRLKIISFDGVLDKRSDKTITDKEGHENGK